MEVVGFAVSSNRRGLPWQLCLLLLAAFAAGEPYTDINTCINGFTMSGDRCYLYKADPLSWIDARSMCDAFDAKLLFIDTETKQRDVMDFLSNKLGLHEDAASLSGSGQAPPCGDNPQPATRTDSVPLWTSGNNGVGDSWRWMHKSFPRNVTYTNWARGQGARESDVMSCVALDVSNGGQWLQLPCEQRHAFVCDRGTWDFWGLYSYGMVKYPEHPEYPA